MAMRRILFGLVAVASLIATAAWAIQPGTTGTEKRFQQEGLRSGVLVQTTATATASAGAVTLNNAGSGVLTSESITTAAGSNYTMTLTSNMIAATDVVLATASLGSATTGEVLLESVKPTSTGAVFIVRNNHGSAAFNGTVIVRYMVVKQTALGAD